MLCALVMFVKCSEWKMTMKHKNWLSFEQLQVIFTSPSRVHTNSIKLWSFHPSQYSIIFVINKDSSYFISQALRAKIVMSELTPNLPNREFRFHIKSLLQASFSFQLASLIFHEANQTKSKSNHLLKCSSQLQF